MKTPHGKWIALLAAMWAAAGAGCGGGLISDFSGGSVPVGHTNRMAGRVVLAADSTTPVANALIHIKSTAVTSRNTSGAAGEVSVTVDARTGKDGTFALTGVPAGAGASTLEVTVSGPDDTLRPLDLRFTVAAGQDTSLVAALASTTYDVRKVASVDLTPSSVSVSPNTGLTLHATARDATGAALPVQTSLVLVGGAGVLSADGTFLGTAPGTATVTAFWYGGIASPAATVKVETAVPGRMR